MVNVIHFASGCQWIFRLLSGYFRGASSYFRVLVPVIDASVSRQWIQNISQELILYLDILPFISQPQTEPVSSFLHLQG